MRLVYLTSEMAPFAKTGGLADVLGALPAQMQRMGHEVRVFMPAYASIDRKKYPLSPAPGLEELDLHLGSHRYRVGFATTRQPGTDLTVHLVHCPALFGRPGIYSSDPDEHRRFLCLSWAALEACRQLRFAPDVVHCNDWQTGLVPLGLKTIYARDPVLGRARSLLTIHNLQYQGGFPASILGETRLQGSAPLFHQDQLKEGRLSFLLHGVLYADGITTVSPTYSREIQTPEHGAGLDHLLRERSSRVVGVLNGVDYREWSPESDRLIPHRFSAEDLSGKEKCKEVLLGKLGLPYRQGVPVLGVVSRLVAQKGLDLLLDVAPDLLTRWGFQLVVLGSGEGRLEERFAQLQAAYRPQVCFYRGFNNELAHLIEAGADAFVMPSRYEPCGLNQLYSLRYGTVPIVHRTGGLADTVIPFDARTGQGTGVAFEHHDAQGLRWAIETALNLYKNKPAWRRCMLNGMAQDYSWEKQAKVYEELYRRAQQV
ncbi:MAG: glycogen synthase [Archangiaceae bacterium]|nr:glycogen synthase [Archangiaceae bacterium]